MDRGGHTDTTHTYKRVASGDMRSSRFIGLGEQLDLVGEVIIELGAPGRWRWRRGRQGRGKQNKHRRWVHRGSPDRGVGTSPPVVDSSSETSPDGEAKGHPDHRGESGCSPRRLVEKGRWDGVVVALGEL